MKTREEALQTVQENMNTKIDQKNQAIDALNNLIAQKQMKIDRINAFYDAIAELPVVQDLIANPPPESQ